MITDSKEISECPEKRVAKIIPETS